MTKATWIILITLFLLLISLLISLKFFESQSLKNRQKLPYQNTYDFHGARLNYNVVGEGKKVILLHGSMYSPPWDGFEHVLGEHYQVYIPELPGFGGSDAVEGKIHNTDLFADALCEFSKRQDLQDAPVVALSLGSVVATKSAKKGCLEGDLIFIGFPTEVTGFSGKLTGYLPNLIKRIIVGQDWGKEKLLIPSVNSNIGSKSKDNSGFLKKLKTTDSRAIADVDYIGDFGKDTYNLTLSLNNKIIFIYGELDAQKNPLIKDFAEIEGGNHNIFSNKQKETLEALRGLLE